MKSIEDFFDAQEHAWKLGGKTLSKAMRTDMVLHSGDSDLRTNELTRHWLPVPRFWIEITSLLCSQLRIFDHVELIISLGQLL